MPIDKDPKAEPVAAFKVTVEDCDRWQQRFHRMARTLQNKDVGSSEDKEDGMRMFYTAAAMMQQLASEIQENDMLSDVPNPFNNPMGEA